jgi:hypothetical protein
MAEEVVDPAGTTPAEALGADHSVVSDPTPAIDPERYAALEAYYTRTNPVLEKYKDDFNAIIEDEDFAKFQRTTRESYYETRERLKKEAEAEIPESEKRLLGEFDKRLDRFKPVLDDYENRAKTQTEAAKTASQEFAKRETEYAERLIADKKLTPEQVEDLGKFAMALHKESVEAGTPRFVGIEEVYKRVYGPAEVKSAAPVPKSLRAKAGATGVPGASRSTERREDLAKPGGVTRHMLAVLNSQRKTG